MAGVSMIEVMISLVIGLVVVGAVLVSFASSGQTGRQQSAYGQMNEDAQIALSVLSRDLLLAGYAQPTAVNTASATFVRTYASRPVFGCDSGFQSPNTTGSVSCNATGTTPALEVVYEADLASTVPTSANLPSDCLGAALTAQTTGSVTFYIARNRYYLATGSTGKPELHCASDRAAATGQPLVENIENMKLWYGEANAAAPRQVVRYVSASNVTDWNYVVSVRACVLMRSSDPVPLDDVSSNYLDCDGNAQAASDRYLRRSYFTTATLRNKMAL